MNFAIAVKAFIVRDGKVLVLKRRSTDVHKPRAWDIPGGRLDPGEDPFDGLHREVAEETGLAVTIGNPLTVHSFTRDDGQRITMLIFLCETNSGDVVLSHEHTEFRWVSPDEARALMPIYTKDVDAYERYFA